MHAHAGLALQHLLSQAQAFLTQQQVLPAVCFTLPQPQTFFALQQEVSQQQAFLALLVTGLDLQQAPSAQTEPVSQASEHAEQAAEGLHGLHAADPVPQGFLP